MIQGRTDQSDRIRPGAALLQAEPAAAATAKSDDAANQAGPAETN